MNKKPHLMKTIGQWTWNSQSLLKKVDRSDPNGCHPWLGSQGPHAPLFGARKNNKAQMTQAARMLYRELYNKDCEGLKVTHNCGNRNCMNPDHWLIVPVKTEKDKPEPRPISKAKLKEITNKFF